MMASVFGGGAAVGSASTASASTASATTALSATVSASTASAGTASAGTASAPSAGASIAHASIAHASNPVVSSSSAAPAKRASALQVSILGIGLLGPGLASWAAGQAVLDGREPYTATPAILAPPLRLPPAERRRAGASIRLAMAVADEAVAQAGLDPQQLATVFTSSGGEGSNCHLLCETLASADRHLSPTRFTNSVHNAAAGYWHIAVASQAASSSLSAFDGSFGAGLIEAATQVGATGAPVLLVACDVPYPQPLHALRTLPHSMGLALVLAPANAGGALAHVAIELVAAGDADAPAHCADAGLDELRTGVPAAAALPLLEALARRRAVDALVLRYLPALHVRVRIDLPDRPA